jgi:DNA-binding response OmpR family regulator
VAGDDLLFSSRIEATLRQLGYRPILVHTAAAFDDALRTRPAAAILNLASRTFDATAAIRRAKEHAATGGIAFLGFCGHADTARREAARIAGCDLVATNGEVAGGLPRLLSILLTVPPPRTAAQ